MNPTLSVLVVSPHKLLRDCLVASLAAERDFSVVVAVASPQEAFDSCLAAGPRLLVVDAALPEDGATALIRCVHGLGLGTRVAILGLPEDEEAIVAAIEVGADACVAREAGLEELKSALRGLAVEESFCSPRIAYRLAERVAELASSGSEAAGSAILPHRPPQRDRTEPRERSLRGAREPLLTRREEEILALVAQGLSNKEIARRLLLSLATVKNHVHNILDKLGVSGRWAAAAYLRDQGRRPVRLAGGSVYSA